MRRLKKTAAMMAAVLLMLDGIMAPGINTVNAAGVAVEAVQQKAVRMDGAYIVPIYAYQAYTNTPSMAQDGMAETASVVIKDGKAVMKLSFGAMEHYGFKGYMSHISYLSNMEFQGTTPLSYDEVPAVVLSSHDVIDPFNKQNSPIAQSAGIRYPKEVQITASAKEEDVWLKVFIPAMETIARGEQLIRIRLDYENAVEVANVSFGSASVSMTEKMSKAFPATVTGTMDKAVYTSSNKAVAVVDASGTVTAIGAGTAVITAEAGGAAASYTVTVKKAPTLAIDKSAVTLYTSGVTSCTLHASVTGEGMKPSYKTSNAKVATVSSGGTIKAVGPGSAVITVSAGGISRTCKVTVKRTTLTLSKKTVLLYTAGEKTMSLKASVNGPSKTVRFTSSNAKVASVSSAGKVTAKSAGTATIYAKANGITATCRVTVKKPQITIKKKSLVVKKKKTVKINAKATPAKTITYTSSNKKVAKVSKKGVVTGVKKGKANITVSANGVKKVVKVTVK